MITMKEYRECKEKVNDFERSVIVAARWRVWPTNSTRP